MAVNRTRNKAITLRMTAEELALFQSQFEKSEAKNQTDFVLQLLDEGTPFGEASKRVMNECWVTYRKILEMK